jgi:aerobic-type carbon monoxide dehydrogenase small subunit (CoxS/CutS family)/CO/xanthine dehydrogenase FAD-binding subunit
MLARGIRSYHRPGRIDEALDLAARGAVVLAGGTRLLGSPLQVPNVLDLAALDLSELTIDDGDLRVGAMVTLQELLDSGQAAEATAGLLPEACRLRSVSWMIRGMASIGGESVGADPDSEMAAALLALNAVFTVRRPDGDLEVPALRFLRDPSPDLQGGGIVTSVVVPGAPDGAALERVAVLPSAPPLVAVAVTLSFAGDLCARARIAVTGLEARPARVLEAEARIEGTHLDETAVEKAVKQVGARAAFRGDAHAPASYRRDAAVALARRAILRAAANARTRQDPGPRPEPRAASHGSPIAPLPYFTSGRIELTLNGHPASVQIEARTSLLELLRREGLWGVKHGCETGECGACAVLVDGRPVVSCLLLAIRAQGRAVETVEGLGAPDRLHPVQQAFVDSGAIQCGYCTPAMLLLARSLLDSVPRPTEAQVREALAGCLCRCTGYVKPVEAVLRASRGEPT